MLFEKYKIQYGKFSQAGRQQYKNSTTVNYNFNNNNKRHERGRYNDREKTNSQKGSR